MKNVKENKMLGSSGILNFLFHLWREFPITSLHIDTADWLARVFPTPGCVVLYILIREMTEFSRQSFNAVSL